MSSLKQVVIFGTSASIIGGWAAAYTYLNSEDNTIKGEILRENKKLLAYEASQELWDLKLHTLTSSSKKGIYNITLSSNTWENLRDWCKEAIKKEFEEEDNHYTSTKDLCTVPSNKEKLLKLGKELAGDDDWTQKAKEYKAKPNNILSISSTENEAIVAMIIKNWCSHALEKEYTKKEKNIYNQVLISCIKTVPQLSQH